MSDSWIIAIVKDAAAQTSIGLAARASGVWDYTDKDLGTLGEIAAGVGGFVMDPPTYLGGGLGGLATKAIAKGVGKKVQMVCADRLVAALYVLYHYEPDMTNHPIVHDGQKMVDVLPVISDLEAERAD